mgnify:FL=1
MSSSTKYLGESKAFLAYVKHCLDDNTMSFSILDGHLLHFHIYIKSAQRFKSTIDDDENPSICWSIWLFFEHLC